MKLIRFAALLCPALAACATAPPGGADPIAALAADSAAILDGLRFLSSDDLAGRANGSEGAAQARSFLADELLAAGLHAPDGGIERPFEWMPRNGTETRQGVNVVALRAGTDRPDRFIVVTAHYDHVGVRNGEIFNGADDNASGSMGLAALARALRGHELRHSVVFAALDAEEVGLRGAHALIEAPPVPLDAIEVNVNLDMVARTGGELWAAGSHHTPALQPILQAVAAQAPVRLLLGHDRPGAPEGDDWTRSSDHGAFHQAGIPFVYFGVEDHPDYHRPTDDFENVDPGEYMNALRTVLLTILALDEALPLAVGTTP